jgi:CheY-like chemotaxis protein
VLLKADTSSEQPIRAGFFQLSENTGRPLEGRILVVDDLNDAAASLALVCELYGAHARVARDGREALTVGASFLPDVVLMDISMPHMDGYEAARRMKAESWGKEVVLIAMTGWGRQGDIDAAHAAGFDGHLLKPVSAEAVIELITRLRGRKSPA